jgi:microcystin-dependent protein
MSTPFLAQISVFSFGFAPKGWALCNGQLLPINQNQAVFSLLGTTYGGDGRTNFALPNLQGRVPVHMGSGFTLGQAGGEDSHTLAVTELPAHSHPANCSGNAATLASPAGEFWAADNAGNLPYSTTGSAAMAGGSITPTGGSQPHNNLAPYNVLNFAIALQGIFPSQN